MELNQIKNKTYLLLLIVVLLCGCNTTKFLAIDKAFLIKNEIVIKDKISDKLILHDELETLYKQKPTPRIRRRIFYTSTGRFQKRFGENPVLFDDFTSNKTAESMKFFLQSKGYYDAEVKYYKTIKRQHAKVKYAIELHKPYTINELEYKCKDPSILKIVETVKNETLLKKGALVDVNLYNAELNRLTKVIRNYGYANFYANYFTPLEGDTTDHKTNISLEILSPEDTAFHRKYQIRNIQVLTEYVTVMPETRRDTIIDGVLFIAPSGDFGFKINSLLACIPIRKGEIFRQENLELMYNRFEQLKAFRIINIKPVFPQGQKNQVDISITLAQNGKYILDYTFELNNTINTINSGQRSNALGFATSFTFKNNNVFKGGEKYIANIEGGIQGLLQNKNQGQIFGDFKLNNEYYVPKSVDVFGFWKTLNKINFGKKSSKIDAKYRKIVQDDFYEAIKSNAQTKFSVGYNYIQALNLKYQTVNLNYGYVITPNAFRKIDFNHTSLEWLKPIFLGDAIINQPFQKKRFDEQFVTSLIFKNLSLTKYGNSVRKNTNWSLRSSIEQSGLELFGVNKLYNTIFLKENSFSILGSDYTRYVKAEIDFTHGKKFNSKNSVHFRFNSGIAVPYGFDAGVPFVKQFFVGGPSSLRAWRTRELGPGGYIPSSIANNQLFYQTGDIKTELNAEYRFGIYWIFKGAFFIDAGNVWLLKKDPTLPDADFSKHFYKQIAVGSGFGLRIDFDYSVIRFDFAYRVRNPYLNTEYGDYWNIHKISALRSKELNWSVALAYPF